MDAGADRRAEKDESDAGISRGRVCCTFYRPPLLGADDTEEDRITVRLGGPTCLSGDVIGDYKFRQLPEYGDILMFGDMAIYTTCKNNTFNGMPLPNIWLRRADNTMQQLTDFGYADFKERLGSRK